MLSYDARHNPELQQWSFTETRFDPLSQGKCESVMSLGNGYLGLRSATEEAYVGATRNLFVNGMFNKFDDKEVTELPNAADVTQLELLIDGQRFTLETGEVSEYQRTLNLRDAELTRSLIWRSEAGKRVKLVFRRFVSMDDLHLIGMKIEVTPLDEGISFGVVSGINAQLSNSGSQHFHEGEKRIYDRKFLQLIQTTTESGIDFVFNAVHQFRISGESVELMPKMDIDRRKMAMEYSAYLEAGETLELHKLVNVYTGRDFEFAESGSLDVIRSCSLEALKESSEAGYDQLFGCYDAVLFAGEPV